MSLILTILAACTVPDAEPGSIVLPPDDVAEVWDEAYAEPDEVGGTFHFEAVVLGADGAPEAGVRASVLSGWDGAALLAPGARGGPLALDVRSGEVQELAGCAEADAPSPCAWLQLVTGPDGRIAFDVFVDVAPDSGASVPIFISSGNDVASVEIELADPVVVH